ncbi:unnamed protein product [Closterium sp. Naga37s-1]|nr:unnamed protein product [Closterium sp. Naga37s-1]
MKSVTKWLKGFCGNHIPEVAALRVPCPVDPSQYAPPSSLPSCTRSPPPLPLLPSLSSSTHYPPPHTLPIPSLSPFPHSPLPSLSSRPFPAALHRTCMSVQSVPFSVMPTLIDCNCIAQCRTTRTILASEVQSHVAKCPAAVQRGLTEGAAYFKGGLNARGPPLAPVLGGQGTAASASAGVRVQSAAASRRQMVAALGEGEWRRLLHLLGEAHAVAFGGHGGLRLPPLAALGEAEAAGTVASAQAAAAGAVQPPPPAAETGAAGAAAAGGATAAAASAPAAGAAPMFTLQQSVLWLLACDAWEQTARDIGG